MIILSLVFQKSSAELFGAMFQNLPCLSSGFLNTSQQMSRNIQNLKMLSKDVITPTSSPKPKSEAPTSPLLFPRSQPRSRPALSSKPSSPHSQSSCTSQSEASTTASSQSKSKKLPSSLLSPKSITERSPSIPTLPKRTVKNRAYQTVTSTKALSDKPSSPLPPKEPCSPTGPPTHAFNNNLTEEEHLTSPQTGILVLCD